MQNDYNALVANITIDQKSLITDLMSNNSADNAVLTVANAGYSSVEESEEYLFNENFNVLKVVHVQKHREVDFAGVAIKRLFDIFFSSMVMIFGFPIFIMLYLITKFSSQGPAFFSQERVGKDGRKFRMYKFRSMFVDAEKYGPQLSKENDPRITKWGRFIRRTRLDELPQFWNVIKGDMAVVGPRPEREFYINKIVQRNPSYKKLQRIKPGLTSIGQVRYGYAENVDEMCNRLKYDLLYLNNISFNSDLQIIFSTVRIMFEKKGK